VWGVTQGQLKQQAGIDGKALNVEQSLDDLKIALGAVVAFSAIAAVGSGLASKQLTELITPLYCSVAVAWLAYSALLELSVVLSIITMLSLLCCGKALKVLFAHGRVLLVEHIVSSNCL
jgi:hypothetical protein